MPPGSEALQSPAASTASQEVTPAPTESCSEVQLSTQLQHMATYPAVMTLLLLDTLTVMQKALWIIGSYPWCVLLQYDVNGGCCTVLECCMIGTFGSD